MPDVVRGVKITYRSGVNGRVAVAYAKVQYGSMVDLAMKLARLFEVKQVRWYRIDPMTGGPDGTFELHRKEMTRWPEALAKTVELTKIDLLA